MTELTKSQKTNARRKSRTPEEILADQKRLRPDGVKMCSKCPPPRPLSEFSADVYRADGLSVMCNDCWAVLRRRKKGDPEIKYFFKKCRGCERILHINKFSSYKCNECQNAIDEESKRLKDNAKEHRRSLAERKKSFRVCKTCDIEKPMGDFNKLKRGVSWSCNVCKPPPEARDSKECSSCHIEFPMNEFTSNKYKADGKGTMCIECRVKYNARKAVKRSERTDAQILDDQSRLRPTGRKECPKCNNEFILEEFGRNVYTADGTGQYCKKCIRIKNAKTANINLMRTDEEVEAKRNQLRPEGVKACRHCRKTKAFDKFYIQKAEPDGLTQTCKECSVESGMSRDSIIKQLVSLYGDTCLYPECNSTELSIDHVTPLSQGGSSDMDNYQQLCRNHNSSKSATSVDYRPHR